MSSNPQSRSLSTIGALTLSMSNVTSRSVKVPKESERKAAPRGGLRSMWHDSSDQATWRSGKCLGLHCAASGLSSASPLGESS